MNLTHLNILLADDDPDDCLFFKEALNGSVVSTHLTIVNDGEHLMEMLMGDINLWPDVLFLDLNMPRKNGFECLSEIKMSSKLKLLPVIVFSTSFEQEAVNLLYQSGAKYFFRKPSEFFQFKKIIQHAITLMAEKEQTPSTKEHFVIASKN